MEEPRKGKTRVGQSISIHLQVADNYLFLCNLFSKKERAEKCRNGQQRAGKAGKGRKGQERAGKGRRTGQERAGKDLTMQEGGGREVPEKGKHNLALTIFMYLSICGHVSSSVRPPDTPW